MPRFRRASSPRPNCRRQQPTAAKQPRWGPSGTGLPTRGGPRSPPSRCRASATATAPDGGSAA
eukprot:6624246-Alexandrium_andersonii.AAC.1